MSFIFGRQWFPPNTQLAIDHELDQFWFLFKKGEFDRSISFINQFIYHSNEAKTNNAFKSYCSRLKGLVDFYQLKTKSSVISVYADNFWPGFDWDKSSLRILFEKALNKQVVSVESIQLADFYISSIFGKNIFRSDVDHLFKVLFLGERLSPIYSNFDLSLSMDLSDYGGNNIYCPLWFLSLIDYGLSTNRSIRALTQQINSNHSSLSCRQYKAIYVGSNDHPMRKTIINALNDCGIETSVFGNNYRPLKNKIIESRKYILSICPENTWSPGYTTEKIIDALIAGCIPIHWGYLDFSIFNKRCIYSIDFNNSSRVDISNILSQGFAGHLSRSSPALFPESISSFERTIVIALNSHLSFLL